MIIHFFSFNIERIKIERQLSCVHTKWVSALLSSRSLSFCVITQANVLMGFSLMTAKIKPPSIYWLIFWMNNKLLWSHLIDSLVRDSQKKQVSSFMHGLSGSHYIPGLRDRERLLCLRLLCSSCGGFDAKFSQVCFEKASDLNRKDVNIV